MQTKAKRINPDQLGELVEFTVHTKRVAKVVKGGRNFSFNAMVVVGDKNGHVGVGVGKAREIANAIRKATERAKKEMFTVPVIKETIPHEIVGRFGAAKVLLKPAAFGTGVIAGGAVRAVLEAAGIRNILTKSLKTNNPYNVVKATVQGLQELRTIEDIAKLRNKTVEEIRS